MQTMSFVKKSSRWEPKNVKLRRGQQRLYEVVRNEDKRQYVIQLPTGYGKSWCACIAYAVLRDKGDVNRCLIIVPTDQQRSQYIDGLREDLTALGISYSGIERCDNKAGWVIKKAYRNESEIFVAGVQSVAADPGYYADLMSKGGWLLVADEFHHYGNGNTWGKAVSELPYEKILGMSATPFRADKKLTVFGETKFDVSVSVNDAYLEGAIRRIKSRIGDYTVSWSSLDSPEPQSSLMSELSAEWNTGTSDVSLYEIQKGVRYYDKYISEIFLQVLAAWSEYERLYPGQNQILVFTMSCRHAEIVTKIINECAFPGFPEPFADWIGVGNGDTENRSDKENAAILDLFQSNRLPCLVQVNKAGEGFNNKRCSIGLFLDLVGDTPMKRQHIGRFMRVNNQAPDIPSLIFVSEDSPARALLEGIEDTFEPDQQEKDQDGQSGKTRELQLAIPDIYVIDTAFESERVVYPFGTPEATLEVFQDASEDLKQVCESIGYEQALKMFQSVCEPLLKDLYRKQHPPLTSEQRRNQVKDQVKRNTGILISNLLRKRYGKSFPKTAKSDMYRLVNSRWKRMHSSHAEMTEQDLKAKNNWLKELNDSINTNTIPSWLNL